MANERLLVIELDERAVYHGSSPEAQVYPLRPREQIFVYPLIEQNFESGSVALGVIDEKGRVLPEKYYFPFVATRKEELESALKDFEDLIIKGQGIISNRERLELLGRIELCIYGAQVIGPDNLQPF